MANKKASIKDVIRTKRNRLRNVHFKSLMKTLIKKANQAIESKDTETVVRKALTQIDKTASKGIIHKNAAARKKSTLAKKFAQSSK